MRNTLVWTAGLALMAIAAWTARGSAPAAPAQAADAPVFTMEHWPPEGAAARGRVVYEGHCVGCHGEEGRGDGPASRWLDPLPRDFQKGRFKFRSTPSGELPTEADLMHIVTCGLNGSSMPGFPLMSERHRREVVAYVRYLALYGMIREEVESEVEDGASLEDVLAEDLGDIVEETYELAFEDAWPVTVEPEGWWDEETVARGRELYEAQCVACHGDTGRGDGPSSFTLRDWKDASIRPRDFTTGIFRAGSEPVDVFLRLRTGLNGTPMPAVSGSDEDLWAMTRYILSLQDEGSRQEPHPVSCEAHARQRLGH